MGWPAWDMGGRMAAWAGNPNSQYLGWTEVGDASLRRGLVLGKKGRCEVWMSGAEGGSGSVPQR